MPLTEIINPQNFIHEFHINGPKFVIKIFKDILTDFDVDVSENGDRWCWHKRHNFWSKLINLMFPKFGHREFHINGPKFVIKIFKDILTDFDVDVSENDNINFIRQRYILCQFYDKFMNRHCLYLLVPYDFLTCYFYTRPIAFDTMSMNSINVTLMIGEFCLGIINVRWSWH